MSLIASASIQRFSGLVDGSRQCAETRKPKLVNGPPQSGAGVGVGMLRVLWLYGCMVLLFYGFIVLWLYGFIVVYFMVFCLYGFVVLWF